MSLEELVQSLVAAINKNTAALGGKPAAAAAKPKPEEAAAPRGRGRPAKPKPEEEEEEEEGNDDLGLGGDDLGLGEEEEPDVTQEDVVNAFKTLKSSHGVEKCREVLAKLGETNVLNIPPKKYGEALKEINRAASKKK